MVADSPDARCASAPAKQLAPGASQIKVMAGGVASNYDPIDVTQHTVPEIRAAVEAADNWGTYADRARLYPRSGAPGHRGGRQRASTTVRYSTGTLPD